MDPKKWKYGVYDGKTTWILSDQKTPEKFAAKKVTVTGSRIPRGDRNAAGLKSTGDKNSITDMMRPTGGGGTPGS